MPIPESSRSCSFHSPDNTGTSVAAIGTFTLATSSTSTSTTSISTTGTTIGISTAPTPIVLAASPSMSSTVSSSTPSAADVSRRMLCGGVAGMVAKTVTNPLERIKILSQTGGASGAAASSGGSAAKPPSILRIYQSIIQREGIIGLWAGNGANLLRIAPSKAVVFSTQDIYKDLLRQLTGATANTTTGTTPLSPVYSFLAGGMAGMTATAATYPLDLARGRISGTLAAAAVTTTTEAAVASNHQATKKAYSGLIQTMVLTVKDEGIAGLYRGITPTILGSMPYVGIQFGTVAVLERLFPRVTMEPSSVDPQQQQQSQPSNGSKALRKMMFGGLGGVTAGLITYPNDTVRRLLQLQGSRGTSPSNSGTGLPLSNVPHQYAGYWDCVVQTYRTEGIGRFYRGLTINLIRMAPNTAVQFGTYEFLHQATKSWTAA